MALAGTSLVGALADSLRRNGHVPALVEGDPAAGAFALSAGDVLRRAEVRRRWLRAIGLGRGDRVYVRSGRGIGYWADLIAVWASGATAIPIDCDAGADREAKLFAMVEPDMVLGEDMAAPSEADEEIELEEWGLEADPAAILFTSGSTGEPKGVSLRGSAILGNARAALALLDLRPGDALFVATPFTFTSALCHFLAAVLAGARLITTEKRLFKADLHAAVAASGANCFGGAPLQAQWLADVSAAKALSLRWIMSSGDHLRPSTVSAIRSNLPDTAIYSFYGLTETGGRFCAMPPDCLDEAPDAVGAPIEGLSMTVRDEDGAEVPRGETGEIYACGAYLFDGYFGDTDATISALTELGLRTGDLGFVGSDGWLRVTGRADDVFKCAGQKVSAVPIADVLMGLGLFDDVAVVARAHAIAGNVPWVVYVPKPGAELDMRQVGGALRKALLANHVPQGFLAVDQIPRTGSGKIERRRLAKLVEDAA